MLDARWMFEDPLNATRREIFSWWEARRPNYNVLMLVVGAVSWGLILVAGSQAVNGEDFEEPIMMIIGPPIYLGLANLCYTLGPLLDVTLYRGTPRVKLFKIGVIFSLLLTALPGLWAIVAWMITVYTGKKL